MSQNNTTPLMGVRGFPSCYSRIVGLRLGLLDSLGFERLFGFLRGIDVSKPKVKFKIVDMRSNNSLTQRGVYNEQSYEPFESILAWLGHSKFISDVRCFVTAARGKSCDHTFQQITSEDNLEKFMNLYHSRSLDSDAYDKLDDCDKFYFNYYLSPIFANSVKITMFSGLGVGVHDLNNMAMVDSLLAMGMITPKPYVYGYCYMYAFAEKYYLKLHHLALFPTVKKLRTCGIPSTKRFHAMVLDGYMHIMPAEKSEGMLLKDLPEAYDDLKVGGLPQQSLGLPSIRVPSNMNFHVTLYVNGIYYEYSVVTGAADFDGYLTGYGKVVDLLYACIGWTAELPNYYAHSVKRALETCCIETSEELSYVEAFCSAVEESHPILGMSRIRNFKYDDVTFLRRQKASNTVFIFFSE